MSGERGLRGSGVDASELEVFLALAEELHFGRTAERLHLPQSRVSRLVASLERRVGGALFERTTRRVRLTPLGRRLRDRAGPAWAEVHAALQEAQDEARAAGGTLRIGCTAFVGGAALSRLVEEFCARYPGCEVTLGELGMWDPYGPLRGGEVDVVVNWLAVDEPDLTAGPVIDYRDRMLAVGSGHRLAGRDSVAAEELADEETHELPPSFPAALGDAIIPRFTPSGRPIRRTLPYDPAEDGVALVGTLVAMGRTVHPTMAGVPLFHRPDIALIPITGLPPMPLGLIWCTAHENARIRALAAVARQFRPRPRRRRATPIRR